MGKAEYDFGPRGAFPGDNKRFKCSNIKRCLNAVKIRAKTKCNAGKSIDYVIASLNPTLIGWYGYFQHAHRFTFTRSTALFVVVYGQCCADKSPGRVSDDACPYPMADCRLCAKPGANGCFEIATHSVCNRYKRSICFRG